MALTQASRVQAEQLSVHRSAQTDAAAQRRLHPLNEFMPLVRPAIDPARRRVLPAENLPAAATVVSVFEPHTPIMRRGQPKPRATEFGHTVHFAEVEQGFSRDWQIIATGNPPDAPLRPARRRHHSNTIWTGAARAGGRPWPLRARERTVGAAAGRAADGLTTTGLPQS